MSMIKCSYINFRTYFIEGDCHDDDAMFTKDLRSSRFKNYDEMDDVQTVQMPTRTEGAIPRLWEVTLSELIIYSIHHYTCFNQFLVYHLL